MVNEAVHVVIENEDKDRLPAANRTALKFCDEWRFCVGDDDDHTLLLASGVEWHSVAKNRLQEPTLACCASTHHAASTWGHTEYVEMDDGTQRE